MERLVAGIWQSVLAINQIDIHENFFDLGGHSLLIISVQAQLQKNTGLEINIVDFFRFTTVSSLASHLDRLQNSPVAAPQKDGEHRLVRDRIEKQKETARRAATRARERNQLPTDELRKSRIDQ
jgi:acyl carrier protein